MVYLGIRPANEPGFIYKFRAYDYSENGDKEIHLHKYDQELIDRLVNWIFDRNKAIIL